MKALRNCDRPAKNRRLVVLLAGLGLVAAACSSNGSIETTSTSAGATSTLAETNSTLATIPEPVTVVEDLVYLSSEPVLWKLDVHYSPDALGGPVVVFFHGGGFDKGFPIYRPIAEAIAEGGGVVFMPDWDDKLRDGIDAHLAVHDEHGCAICYALAHASEYGADPETLILAGHSGGAGLVPAAGGMREVSPVAGCAVEMGSIEASGMVLWDGDWLKGDPPWNRYGSDLGEMMEVLLPWGYLEDAPRIPIVLATSSEFPQVGRRCDVEPGSSFWDRDPDGWFYEQLDSLGMLDDGCIDNGEGQELLTQTLVANGFDATHLILEDSGHVNLSDQGQTQLVEAILTISDR